jgi:glycosyltransferase involved in cell wall biosynthesis
LTFFRTSNVTIASIRQSLNGTGAPAWAHVSGWAQLSGSPRQISCVVSCRNAARAIAQLVPELSDTLTEVGFPWEITFVDRASADETDRLLSGWADVPGVTWIRLAEDCGEAAAIATGVRDARGDAVIVINATANPSLELLPEMISRWDEGNEIVFVDHGNTPAKREIVCWTSEFPGHDATAEKVVSLAVAASAVILMDRQIVDSLLAPSDD